MLILPSLWWGEDERAPGPRWEILGDRLPGTYAEYVTVPDDCLVPKPAGLSWAQAAALPVVGVTAYRALFPRAGLRSGESVLILGAGGGIATMAVTLAAGTGCPALVTSSSHAKIEQAVSLGAQGGVLYTDPEWPAAARRLSPSGRGFDVVLDPVGNWREALQVLRPGGRLVVLGASRAEEATLDVRRFYFGQFDLLGTTLGSRRDLAGLLAFMARHDVGPPPIDRVYGLGEAAQAHAYLETGAAFGKVVLACDR